MDELVSVTRHRPHEPRLARVVTEHATDGADRLAERAVRDDDIRPDRIEDVAAMDRVAAPLDEEHQQIEIAGDQRLGPASAQEDASAWRQDEVVEPVLR